MSQWISIAEYHRRMRAEAEAMHRRGELLNLYFGNWTDEEWNEMSNRKKLKDRTGYRVTHSVVDEIDRNTPMQKVAKISNYFSGRYNAYTCNTCNKAYLTLDVEPGTTPMFMKCYATEGCNGQTVSAGYPDGEPPEYMGAPIIHWMRPNEQEFEKLTGALKQHVVRGGLIAKPTEDAPEWVKAALSG